ICLVVELNIQMEAWEALDLDDSDLPSLLSPCKRRRRRHNDDVRAHQNPTSAGGDDSIVPTQEYIRRAVEDGEEYEDFNRNPWLCALQFLGRPTKFMFFHILIGLLLFIRIVAVIRSSTPNGLGDLMVTLKDSTGTIDASIHLKVLAEDEFGKEISVGSVLILQKVVFAPLRSTRYLNITLSNVVKVHVLSKVRIKRVHIPSIIKGTDLPC
ncbi:uncharacterized protein LOC130749923, partial [Actinidia eriantha]|uniref:uncharacterized protein LOC130749923 n=1 Tax=Actinidia eriantha TaxID=165200 RepID=UPI002587758C